MGTILFDAYGTLLDEGKESIPLIASMVSNRYGIPASAIITPWAREYFAREEAFRTTFKSVLGANAESLRVVFSELGLPPREADEFSQTLVVLWSHPELFDDVQPAFDQLRSRHTIGIVSNADEESLHDALRWTGLRPHYILTSERARSYKPDVEIFNQALSELGIGAQDATYVGNSPADIIGAKQAGMRMIHLNRHSIDYKGIMQPDETVEDMDGLLALLDP